MTSDHWRDLLPPSRWLYAHMLKGKCVTLTIKSAKQEHLMRQGIREPEPKAVLEFEETDKALVANKTNLAAIASLHGPQPSKWKGKKVTLFETTTRRGKETVPCIRIKGAK